MAVLSSYIESKLLGKFSFAPTECQKRLFKSISSFLVEGDTDIMIVNGFAGTGKSESLGALVSVMREMDIKYRLMAPTGRAAKVLSVYTGSKAKTIHKQIYRQKSLSEGVGQFTLDINKLSDAVFIVDEASLISIDSAGNSIFGSGNLLEDLIEYVRQGNNNRLILVGDNAQLPPVMLDKSPALDYDYMAMFGPVLIENLTTVVRQIDSSGILYNATLVRKMIEKESSDVPPQMKVAGFPDVNRIRGGELIEALEDAYSKYGEDETVVLCRSNKRANRYNGGIRSTILSREENLVRGDRLMVVKNCYQFLEDVPDLDFIANGDIAELVKINGYEERYGLHFAKAVLSFPDYDNIEITAKVILDTLASETASLDSEQQKALYEGVYADYDNIKTKRKRNNAVREDPYYNALQIKYSAAITCHKSQGGEWKCVFIDNSFYRDEISLEDLKWLYTAITRAVEKVYFVNFPDSFFR